jgi:hypothetical protein
VSLFDCMGLVVADSPFPLDIHEAMYVRMT